MTIPGVADHQIHPFADADVYEPFETVVQRLVQRQVEVFYAVENIAIAACMIRLPWLTRYLVHR